MICPLSQLIGDMSDYIENGEWEIVSIPVEVDHKKYHCCLNTFTELTYKFRMRRKALYYLFNLILPCAIISTLAILAFCINPQSGQRITLSITVMLAMSVFLNFAWSRLPVTSDSVPLLAKYYMMIMTVIGLSLFANCVTLNYFYRDDALSYLPKWFRIHFIDWLAKIMSSLFCMQYPPSVRISSQSFRENIIDCKGTVRFGNRNVNDECGETSNEKNNEYVVLTSDAGRIIQLKPRIKASHLFTRDQTDSKKAPPLKAVLQSTTTHALVAEAKEQYLHFKEIRKRREEDDVDVLIGNNIEQKLLNKLEDDKQFTARIIDLFFFISFLLIFVLSITVLLSGDTTKFREN